jgi:prefoldin subunit 5
MIEEKLKALKDDLEKVSLELDRLSQLRLKLMGAIEVLESLEEKEEVAEPEVIKEKKK